MEGELVEKFPRPTRWIYHLERALKVSFGNAKNGWNGRKEEILYGFVVYTMLYAKKAPLGKAIRTLRVLDAGERPRDIEVGMEINIHKDIMKDICTGGKSPLMKWVWSPERIDMRAGPCSRNYRGKMLFL